ncbi:LOB domain-containing protein 19-like [Actinidia eriantha]|uniref:LOB domain-containing protein 19-like n=1 Tax=Actinidia eriantha TaxID=165200 RepID=UPI00258B3ADC|nr:LOB domain-containing protein 19-like [Actinidia eriantha]
MGSNNSGAGPCGACKFLRRKCSRDCVFAPYFDSDQGPAHFAAVHKVFGASNASKMLLRVPAHKRLDTVVSLCYEALARVRDPVYGCVGHIFTLQQQVVNLQVELAYTQARLSTFQCLPLPQPPQPQSPSPANLQSSSQMALSSNASTLFDASTSMELVSFCNAMDQEFEDGDLQAIAREFVSRYLQLGVKVQPSNSQ